MVANSYLESLTAVERPDTHSRNCRGPTPGGLKRNGTPGTGDLEGVQHGANTRDTNLSAFTGGVWMPNNFGFGVLHWKRQLGGAVKIRVFARALLSDPDRSGVPGGIAPEDSAQQFTRE